jgi:hypothetical protein
VAVKRTVIRNLACIFAGVVLLHAAAAFAEQHQNAVSSGAPDPEARACAALTGRRLAESASTKYVSADPAASVVQLQRRLCMHPAVAKYTGAGDPNDAASFICVKEIPPAAP